MPQDRTGLRLIAGTVALAVAIFMVDLLVPLGVAMGVLYVVPILIALRSPQPRFVFGAALACTILTILGFILGPPGGILWMGIANRALSIFAIWVTAILSLQQKEAEEQIQLLRRLLPICSSCKKIRDDQGYWNQVERYLETHTRVVLTHSICPECVEKWYPELHPELAERYPKLYEG